MDELALAVEGYPERAVGGCGHPARHRIGLEVDRAQLARAGVELAEPSPVVRAVRDVASLITRVSVGTPWQLVVGAGTARGRVETADAAAAVHREPDDPRPVGDQGMRVAARGGLELRHLACGRIEAPDRAVAVAR